MLTRAQWRGVIDFAKAVEAQIVTSFATSPGARDANGVWTTDQAKRWLAYTNSIGGEIAAAEFANEPNMLWLTQPPKNYTGADYRRDYARFSGWLRQNSPTTLLLAPGIAEIGEPFRTMMRERPQPGMARLEGSDLIDTASPKPDRFTYHFYMAVRSGAGRFPASIRHARSRPAGSTKSIPASPASQRCAMPPRRVSNSGTPSKANPRAAATRGRAASSIAFASSIRWAARRVRA